MAGRAAFSPLLPSTAATPPLSTGGTVGAASSLQKNASGLRKKGGGFQTPFRPGQSPFRTPRPLAGSATKPLATKSGEASPLTTTTNHHRRSPSGAEAARMHAKLAEKVAGPPKTPWVALEALEAGGRRNTTEAAALGAGLLEQVYRVTAQNAKDFRFAKGLAAGTTIRAAYDGTSGQHEMYTAYLEHFKLAPSAETGAWVQNHYRWIVWKKASLERQFPTTLANKLLTPGAVLDELYERHSRECVFKQDSALKRILDQNGGPVEVARCVVLCVAAITPAAKPAGKAQKAVPARWQLTLTDGWYQIQAEMDPLLEAMVETKRIVVGTKLFIMGAELIGTPSPSVLDFSTSAHLKLVSNCVRRARWSCKLGHQARPTFPVALRSVHVNGGTVGMTKVCLLRKFPLTFMEAQKDGTRIFRGARADAIAEKEWKLTRQQCSESARDQLVKKWNADECALRAAVRERSKRGVDFTELVDGETIHEALLAVDDQREVQLSTHQQNNLEKYRQSLHESRQDELRVETDRELQRRVSVQMKNGARDVSSLLKFMVCDGKCKHCGGGAGDTQDQDQCLEISCWRPSNDLVARLREGCWYDITSLTVKGTSGRNWRFTTMKQTKIRQLAGRAPAGCFHQRKAHTVEDLAGVRERSDWFDLAGVVVARSFRSANAEPVARDGQPDSIVVVDKNDAFLRILFEGGIEKHGVVQLLEIDTVVAMCNLDSNTFARHDDMATAVAKEYTTFSSALPRDAYLADTVTALRASSHGRSSAVAGLLQELDLRQPRPLNRSNLDDIGGGGDGGALGAPPKPVYHVALSTAVTQPYVSPTEVWPDAHLTCSDARLLLLPPPAYDSAATGAPPQLVLDLAIVAPADPPLPSCPMCGVTLPRDEGKREAHVEGCLESSQRRESIRSRKSRRSSSPPRSSQRKSKSRKKSKGDRGKRSPSEAAAALDPKEPCKLHRHVQTPLPSENAVFDAAAALAGRGPAEMAVRAAVASGPGSWGSHRHAICSQTTITGFADAVLLRNPTTTAWLAQLLESGACPKMDHAGPFGDELVAYRKSVFAREKYHSNASSMFLLLTRAIILDSSDV